jgi:hypothetical protein
MLFRRWRVITFTALSSESGGILLLFQESFRKLYRDGTLDDRKITVEVPTNGSRNIAVEGVGHAMQDMIFQVECEEFDLTRASSCTTMCPACIDAVRLGCPATNSETTGCLCCSEQPMQWVALLT